MRRNKKCGDVLCLPLHCTNIPSLALLLSISIWCVSIFWVNIVPSVTQAFIHNIGGFFGFFLV